MEIATTLFPVNKYHEESKTSYFMYNWKVPFVIMLTGQIPIWTYKISWFLIKLKA